MDYETEQLKLNASSILHREINDKDVYNHCFPDKTKCKIAKPMFDQIGGPELCECLVRNQQSCQYAISFGYSSYCQHLDRYTFPN